MKDRNTETELTSNVVSIADRRLQRKRQPTSPAPFSYDEALLSQVNKLTEEVIDARREIDSLTNTVYKLLKLLKVRKQI